MMVELENIITEIRRFEERVDAIDYAIQNIVSIVKLTNYTAIGGKDLGSWYWLSGADIFLYSADQLKALGVTRNEIKNKIDRSFFSERIHPDDYKKFKDHFEACVEGKIDHDVFEYRIKSKNGSYKTFYNVIDVAMKSKTGRPLVLEGKIQLLSKSL